MNMRFLQTILLSILIPSSSFAQNTEPVQPLQPVPTVTIDAKAVQVVLNDEHRQGIDWEAIVTDFHSLQLKKENNPAWSDQKFKLSVGEVSNEDYAVLLEALDTAGSVAQTDFPQVVLYKDQPKDIDVSPDSRSLPSIYLDLKWVNSPAGEPKLKIDSFVGASFKEMNQSSTVETLKNQTEVNLSDRTTIVIGGLMHEDEITKIRKFPLLGDLPLVGLVFRKQGKLMQETETIIFLTVHTGAVQMPVEGQN